MKKTVKTYTVRELTQGFTYDTHLDKGLYGLDGTLLIQPDARISLCQVSACGPGATLSIPVYRRPSGPSNGPLPYLLRCP